MGFRTGAAAAEEAAARTSFHKTEFLTIEDGHYINLRFLTDERDWITVDQHNMIPTRPAPEGQTDKWPAKMAAVCRMEQGFGGEFSDCFICDHVQINGKPAKRQQRTWGLAVVREEVYENGRIVGLKDATEEVEIDGVKKTVPKIVVINQAWSMFWANFSGYIQMHGTVLDRDFRISRKGKELDTTYSVAPFDPINVTENGQQVRWDLREERFMAPYKEVAPNLIEIIKSRASDEFYALFFDVRVPQPKRESSSGGDSNQAQAPAAPSNDAPSPAELAALAARAESYGPSPAPQPGQSISFGG